ncbi:MAG: BON domain-containing protein [Candidatus Acidiferrales bacterium]
MRRSSTIALVSLAAILTAGCAKKPDDGAIATKIKSQMFSSSLLKNSDLRVNASNGTVTLSGSVTSDTARQEAYKLASQTPGVIQVIDQMTVNPPAGAAPETVAQAPGLEHASRPAAAQPSHRPRDKKKSEPETEPTQSAQITPEPQPALQPAPAPLPPPQPAVAPAPTPPPPAPPPQPKQVVVPANSTLTVRMIDTVDSSVNHAGEIFHASLEVPLTVDDRVVVPRGADVYVRLSAAKSAGRMKGKSELHMEILKLEFQGRSYPVVSSTYSATGSSRGKNTAKKIGGGAAIGAIIGAIAGGGAGAAIGAGVGAGTGAVWNGVTRGEQIKIPAETMLDFQLEEPFTVTVMPRPSSAAQ